jgi:hypothetical protein
MIRGIIDTVEAEQIDRMYDEWRSETDPYTVRDAEPVSWEEAAESLDEMPFPELAQDREMVGSGTGKASPPREAYIRRLLVAAAASFFVIPGIP